MSKYICTNISYDIEDGVNVELPESVTVRVDDSYTEDELEEVLSDAITEATGWCVNGFSYTVSH